MQNDGGPGWNKGQEPSGLVYALWSAKIESPAANVRSNIISFLAYYNIIIKLMRFHAMDHGEQYISETKWFNHIHYYKQDQY